MTIKNSRADALTNERVREIGDRTFTSPVRDDEVLKFARAIRAASPVEQPAASAMDIDSWAEGAKFALRTIAKHDICFLTDSMKMTAVKLATEACVAEKERLINEYPAPQPTQTDD